MTCEAVLTGVGVGEAADGVRVLTRGDPGHEIVHELKPLAGEPIIDKPGLGAFYATGVTQKRSSL